MGEPCCGYLDIRGRQRGLTEARLPDFDQSGQASWHKARVYNGPSLGWTEVQVRPTRTISSAGVFPILPGDSILLVNVAGAVTILLPDVRSWVTAPAYQPATGFERAIFVKDLGGNAGAFPITVQPFAGQAIDLLSSFQIIQARALLRLYPLQADLSGWFSG
jgi:hypothetical protein